MPKLYKVRVRPPVEEETQYIVGESPEEIAAWIANPTDDEFVKHLPGYTFVSAELVTEPEQFADEKSITDFCAWRGEGMSLLDDFEKCSGLWDEFWDRYTSEIEKLKRQGSDMADDLELKIYERLVGKPWNKQQVAILNRWKKARNAKLKGEI